MPKLQLVEVAFYGLSTMWCCFAAMLPVTCTLAVLLLLRRQHEGEEL